MEPTKRWQAKFFLAHIFDAHFPLSRALIEHAKQAGYQIVLYVVALENPETLVERVSQRVREGGHDVPTDKILSRYPRTLANLAKALPLADAVFLYDSQDILSSGLQHIATCRKGVLIEGVADLPVWAKTVLKDC